MTFIKKCKFCGKEFETKRYPTIFCSSSCYFKYRRSMANERRLQELLDRDPGCGAFIRDGFVLFRKRCRYCGREFIARRSNDVYCSRDCHNADSQYRRRNHTPVKTAVGIAAEYLDNPMRGKAIKYLKKCAFCGKEFTAQKRTTMFCSTSCARKYRLRQTESEKDHKVTVSSCNDDTAQKYLSRPYLHIYEVADVLSLSRSTVCRYIKKGILKSVSLPGTVLVRKEEIEDLFEQKKRYYVSKHSIVPEAYEFAKIPAVISSDEYISISEACDLYGLDRKTAPYMIRRSGLEFNRFRNIRFYRREELHAFLVRKMKQKHPEIEEWCTVDDIIGWTGRTRRSVYCLVLDKKIPRKKEGGKTYYSRTHIDAVLQKDEGKDLSLEYYSAEEASVHYCLPKDRLYKIVSRHGVRKKMVRGRVWFLREDLDRLMKINLK